MDTNALQRILVAACRLYRKGEARTERESENVRVVEFFDMPHVSEAPKHLRMIDVHFYVVGVDMAEAERLRGALESWLATYPHPSRLRAGPSYIEIGGAIGDQGMALTLFALGEALDLWRVMKPSDLGLSSDAADRAAGLGYVFCVPKGAPSSVFPAGESSDQRDERERTQAEEAEKSAAGATEE